MIRNPRPGMEVKLHYRRSAQKDMPYQGGIGIIVAIANGRGPKNVLVLVDRKMLIVPRGNLEKI